MQFYPKIVKKGHVYILKTPLFRLRDKKKTINLISISRLDQRKGHIYVLNSLHYLLKNNLIKDFKDEYIGYANSLKLVESLYKNSASIYENWSSYIEGLSKLYPSRLPS